MTLGPRWTGAEGNIMRRSIAAAAVAAGVLTGAAGAAVFSPVDLVGAAETSSEADAPIRERAGAWIDAALAELVEAETIDQGQSDAVREALVEAMPARGPGRGFGGPPLATVAELLDLSVDELRTALRDGQTIADLAAEQGVSVDSLVDSLVAAMDERLSTAVEEGRITQERADEMRANADEHLTAFVNGEHQPRAGHRHGMRRFADA